MIEKIKPDNSTTSLNISTPYLVGVGASAGGLEAINELFDNMPPNSGFAFVVVQHLSPDHKSMMAELLSKHTQMQVLEARDGVVPEPDTIYLLPVKQRITLEEGKIRLTEKQRDHQPNTAIDDFFISLAKDRKERAIGIILSGTGTDGTRGIEAIKNAGGIVIVQDPLTAQFDGMPNSAISTGYIDLILSPDMIAEELLDFVKETPLLRAFTALSHQEEAAVQDILELLYKTTGTDFSNYKRATINRRLAKRMSEKNMKSLSAYHQYMLNQPDEVRRLCKEFLLNVTRFFRDEEAFDHLKRNIIPIILERKEKNETLKVWCVACSTGEEAYSLAMILDECQREFNKSDVEIKIFATDISQEVIEHASRGFYTEEQVKDIDPLRLEKYFIKESNGYRVNPALRKMIVFARHDIGRDPAFSRIDLISCRNMLIYMNTSLQKSIFHKFHFALNEEGYLFLGPSENIGILREATEEVDRKWKIYKCISKIRIPDADTFLHPFEKLNHTPASTQKAKNALNHLSDIFKETLLEEYDYAGIFIDKDFEVKQAIGSFKKFMDFPEGNFNFNLLKLVPTDLAIALSTGVRKAIKDNLKCVMRNVKVDYNEEEKLITVIIKPFLISKTYMQPFLFVVLKEEMAEKRPELTNYNKEGLEPFERIQELEQELRDTKENLQALIEEVESSNEELQSSNEEIVSANEELQSTNEELQSLNEELHTVNVEHQLKIKELIELNDDMTNYFLNTDIGQIIVDRKLLIRKFTPVVTKQVNLIPSDVGRSIVDISTKMIGLDFVNDIKSVLLSGKPMEKEVNVADDKSYLMRIAPYLRQGNVIDGVVVNFIDVTEIKMLSNTLEAVFNSSTSGIIALRAIRNDEDEIIDFQFISVNESAKKLMDLKESVLNKTYYEVYPEADPMIFSSYSHVVESGKTVSFEFRSPVNDKWFEIVAVKMMDGLVITFNDITDKKLASEKIERGYAELRLTTVKLEQVNHKLEQSNMDLMQFASVASHDLKEPLRKIQAFGNLLKEKAAPKLENEELHYLEKVIGSTNRMKDLIDDILTLSRLSILDIPFTPVNLKEILKRIVDDLEISIQEKNAMIQLGDLPEVMGVPGQMHQLFQNLVSNAIKFNNAAPVVKIGVDVKDTSTAKEFKVDPKKYHCIYVEDNGIGFDPQYSEKIFGVFQRLEKTHFPGTGIGLAIAKKIVDNHKGFIKASSVPGKSTRFTVLLPK